MKKAQARSKARLFKNPILEQLSRTSPTLTLIAYLPIVLVALYLSVFYFSWPLTTLLPVYLTGILTWSLVEYLLHRYLFHFLTDHPFIQKFHYIMHGVHHDYPKDGGRLFMPPVPGYLIASLLFLLFYLIMNVHAVPFFGGLITGYLAYVFTHYAIHKYKKPNNRLGRYLWDHHNTHHFKHPDKAFGVSSPLWDYVFGTMPPRKEG